MVATVNAASLYGTLLLWSLSREVKGKRSAKDECIVAIVATPTFLLKCWEKRDDQALAMSSTTIQHLSGAFPLKVEAWGTGNTYTAAQTFTSDALGLKHTTGINCKVKIVQFHSHKPWLLYVTESIAAGGHKVVVYDLIRKENIMVYSLTEIIALHMLQGTQQQQRHSNEVTSPSYHVSSALDSLQNVFQEELSDRAYGPKNPLGLKDAGTTPLQHPPYTPSYTPSYQPQQLRWGVR